ncbi:MAG: response regulator transcription factor [Sulfuricurvum sp.]|nr:response regulator transcription factor [Sulfuricurvum sp.]
MTPRKKVLIVDDDATTRLLVRKVLMKLDFVDFLEAESGKEALKITRKERPNLILMDVVMPGMDGYEACRQIKNDPKLKSTVVIFMTAVRMDEIDDRIIQVQGDDLLRKPLDASELYFRVKNYLILLMPKNDTSEREESSISELMEDFNPCDEGEYIDLGEGFYYQVECKSLCKNQQNISLMKQEILLLEAFIKYRNQVLSYEQLLHIIGKNGDSTIANLRTLIKLLRRKTYKGLIQTLPSVGYRFMLRRI